MKFLDEIVQRINCGETPSTIKLEGIDRAGFCFVCAAIHAKFPDRDILVVLENSREQESVFNEFASWRKVMVLEEAVNNVEDGAEFEPLFFSSWDVLPNDGRLPGVDSISDRLSTISALLWKRKEAHSKTNLLKKTAHNTYGLISENSSRTRGQIVIASAISLIQRTLAPEFLASKTLFLTVGEKANLNQITEHLVNSFYEPVAKVSQKGEFSLRRGILDIYPLTSDMPVRIEFFGDQIDSMRLFDPITQISQNTIDSVLLPPAGEFAIIKNLFNSSSVQKTEVTNRDEQNRATGEHSPINTSTISKAEIKSNEEKTSAFAATLLDYLDSNAIIILCEPEKIADSANSFCSDFGDDFALYSYWNEIIDKSLTKKAWVLELHEEISMAIDATEKTVSDSPCTNSIDRPEIQTDDSTKGDVVGIVNSLEAWRPVVDRIVDYQIHLLQTQAFFNQIRKWLDSGYTALLICPHESQFGRFKELWKDFDLDEKVIPKGVQTTACPDIFRGHASALEHSLNQNCGRLVFFLGSINRGFIVPEEKFVVISDTEIFGRIKCPQPRSLKSKYRSQFFHQLIDITELEEGDYVVHANYGIGRFLGLSKLSSFQNTSVDGEECLVIEYAPSKKGQEPPKLYVPICEAHLVTKYIGSGRGKPILNKLTGKKWQKTKEKAENAIRDYAAELLALQAERMASPGFAFLPDTPWQHDFENTFEFEETPDQLRAILETKQDMESPKPMDRLVCGDAGYGKTEVALRAAFKAVMSGKQVAVLVPTTVLAQQHYMTFTSRMAAFPVNICLLSRFKTKAQQAEIIKKIASGEIEIVIGTHRLIQDDVQFRDLGLLIIDEEQRFGVLHKEKLKFLKRKVDVLTLSATPIPRTLYLALMGVRDMSIIETPPHDRLPIETIVARYDDNLVRDAIRRELNRGGQVYYLHNQIYDIDEVCDKLKQLVPEARIVIGHGRMPPSRLERVMSDFISGKADVLLSTTIVENGLDIPNANTIIIDRADKYGLSDLYQLRGRVGRYTRQAYAYLLIPRHAELLADARKRIAAIKQYSTPGSGFKVAMRDLEIRGAGNILGVEQSGHIAAIGFHLYCQLLNQAIKALKGQRPGVIKNVSVRLDFLVTNPTREIPKSVAIPRRKSVGKKTLFVPREVAYYVDEEEWKNEEENVPIEYAAAYIPLDYISNYSQRTEIYRKIAQVSTIEELVEVENEMRDRFGTLPQSAKFVLKIEEIKIIAAEKNVTLVETEGNKLKIMRNGDYLMLGGKFPRLSKIKPEAKLKEIIYLLKAL